MAIYHMSIKNISRAKGKTAIAAAAYRAGTILTDNETGITHNYVKNQKLNIRKSFCRNTLLPNTQTAKSYGTKCKN